MADYITSALLAAQAKIRPAFNEAELRERQNPILRTGLANQNFLLANIEDIKKSTKRAVKGYQFKKTAAVNGTARSHNFTGAQGDTMEVDLTWGTYSETFGLYLKTGADNVVNNAEILKNQISQAQRIIRERMGAALVTALHAGRTQTANTTVRNGTFNAATDAFEVSNQDQFFAHLKSIMSQHKYYGNLDVVVDSVLDPFARKIAAQGTANGTNLAYQIQGLNIMTHDILGTDVAVSGYSDGGVALALPMNSFAFIPFVEEIYRKGHGSFDDFNGGYSTMPDETGLGVTYMFRGYAVKADGSGNGGTVDDMLYHFQISADVATQIADISTADETPVYEFALVG